MLDQRSILLGCLLTAAVATAGTVAAQSFTTQEFHARTVADHPAAEILRAGRATSLAEADFDGDGVPDLAVAYRLGDAGAIAVYRGEYAALYPYFPAGVARRQALGGRAPQPFDPEPLWAENTAAADFLAAGDFDADGKPDLVAASGGQNALHFRRGDGGGGFAAATLRYLPAPPSALGAFELDAIDGLPEIVAVVDDGASRQLLRFGGPQGAWTAAAQSWPLAERTQSLAAAQLDGDGFYDLAVGGNGGWRQLRGRADAIQGGLEPLAAPPASRQAPRAASLAVFLPLRLDDNAFPDFVTLDAAGEIHFEIQGAASIFTVNTTSDLDDGTCDAAHCSLREAILAANANPGSNIHFSIPGTPPFRIEPQTPLPPSFTSLAILGGSQPGFAGQPLIELHGGALIDALGLWIDGDNSLVSSLIINGFESGPSVFAHAIWVEGINTTVESCWIGASADGLGVVTNTDGIYFVSGANLGRIGGAAAGAGNLVVGHTRIGIFSRGDENRIQGNIVGLDRHGNTALGNTHGLQVQGLAVRVGGTNTGDGNLISGNQVSGLAMAGETGFVQGNRIGTDATGELARANLHWGIQLGGTGPLVGGTSGTAFNLISGNTNGMWVTSTEARVERNRFGLSLSGNPLGNTGAAIQLSGSRNRIGLYHPAGGNLITGNGKGIECAFTGLGNRIYENSIFGNSAANIDCPTPPPVLSGAGSSPSNGTVIEGTFAGSPNREYRIEFFSTESCGAGGVPPGRYFLGFQNVLADAGGNAAFSFQTATAVPPGQVATATANPQPITPIRGDPLEPTGFSACETVVDAESLPNPGLRIPGHILGAAGGNVVAPVELKAWGHAIAALSFAVDLGGCVSFDPVDANADNLPDNVALHLPAGWSASVTYHPADSDGELKFVLFDLPPFIPLATSTIAEFNLGITCPAPSVLQVEPLRFEHAPFASFGNTNGQSVGGVVTDGWIDILPGERGDCNGDGVVDAGDLTACGLEIFDGDGNFWLDVPGGSFPGMPIGCDSNGDTLVDAGDLTCKVLLILQLPCAPSAAFAPTGTPRLMTGAGQEVAGNLAVPILFDTAGRQLTAAVFSLDLAAGVSFDPSDADHDGIPDTVHVFYPGSLRSITYHPEDVGGEIHVMLADLAASPAVLPAGPLLTIAVEPGNVPPAQAIAVGAAPAPSFGNADGSSASTPVAAVLFADGFESGALGAWSISLP